MEDFIQILIFVGIAAFSVIRQLSSSKAEKRPAASPKEVLTESFPPLDSSPDLEDDSLPPFRQPEAAQPSAPSAPDVLKQPEAAYKAQPKMPKLHIPAASSLTAATHTADSSHTAAANPKAADSRPEAEPARIRLRTPQEARRAFLYAEIFQRKYE